MARAEKNPDPLKYHLLISTLRIVGLTLNGIGVLLALIPLIGFGVRFIINDPNDDLPTVGEVAGILGVGFVIGGGLFWFGTWFRRYAEYYRPRFDQAVANIPPVQSPPSALIAIGSHEIHFSRKANRWSRSLSSVGPYDALLPLYGCLLVVISCAYVFRQGLNVPDNIIQLGLAILFTFFVFWMVRRLFLYWRILQRSRDTLAKCPDETYRLRCIGSTEAFDEFGGFADVPFEPMVFNVSWTSAAMVYPVVKRTAAITAGLSAAVTASGMLIIQAPISSLFWTSIAVALVSAYVVTFLIWQTYIEISPGRLDFTQVNIFGRGVPRGFTLDLRSARVLADMRNWQAVIENPIDKNVLFTFSLVLLPRRKQLVYRIFLAAISSHESARGPVHGSERQVSPTRFDETADHIGE